MDAKFDFILVSAFYGFGTDLGRILDSMGGGGRQGKKGSTARGPPPIGFPQGLIYRFLKIH